MVSKLSAQPLSPLDGRYRGAVVALGEHLSEAGLNRARIKVEIEWLIHLANRDLLATGRPLLAPEVAALRAIVENFSDADVETLAATEAVTRHDVKAVEYFLKEKFDSLGLADYKEFIHFGLTSQDINNTATPLMLKEGLQEVILPQLHLVIAQLTEFATQ